MSYLFPLLSLFGLIAVPDAAFSAASEAALLWWTRVLPALWAASPSEQSLRESCAAAAC